MNSANLLLPFHFHNIPVRGRLLRLTGMSEHIPSLESETEVTQTLAEMLAAAALLAHDTKHTLAVSLQLQHPELGALAFANCAAVRNETSVLKAYANEAAQNTPFNAITATEGGLFAVTLEPEDLANRYQSLIPLTGNSAAECLAYYFEHSVQTPTLFKVFTDTESATALMLQALPPAEGQEPLPEDDWTRLNAIMQTLEAAEALDPSLTAETLLLRLFAEDDLSTFDPEHPTFATDDPRPRMLAALANLPADELAELIALGTITLTDNTSGQTVTFTADELAHLQDTPTAAN
jgi:molecular chaperone Hsp33